MQEGDNLDLPLEKNISFKHEAGTSPHRKVPMPNLTPQIPPPTGHVKLTFPDGKEIELPILEGSAGPPMIDIRTLYQKSGYFTFDPGFTATGSCASAITYIDGDAGHLAYRGYRIEDLAEQSSFTEVCYLLLFGELPSKLDL